MTTHEQVTLTDHSVLSTPINSGIYVAFLVYDPMRYQPYVDLRLIPAQLFPEKIYLPKTMPFIIEDMEAFVNALSSAIEYTRDEEKTKIICRRTSATKHEPTPHSPARSVSRLSTIKHRGKHIISQTSSFISTDFLHTPPSTSSNVLNHYHHLDIRKYLVTNPDRIYRTTATIEEISFPFKFRLLTGKEQLIHQQSMSERQRRMSPLFVDQRSASFNWNLDTDQHQFDENDFILFKEHLNSAVHLDLKNCIHQLAVDGKLDRVEVWDVLAKIDQKIIHHQLYAQEISKTIQNLQEAATSTRRKDKCLFSLSHVMKILLRIDQLGKFNQLDQDKVRIFNRRIKHLRARMGMFSKGMKILKNLFQIDFFANVSNREAFSHFVDDDLQRTIPKPVPLNQLGLEEILHQLQLNIDRLGAPTTLTLINSLQRLIHSGLFLTLNKIPQVKRYLTQFIEHIETGRFVGVYLQRLIEQISHSLQMKKVSLTKPLNSLIQKNELISKDPPEKLISYLMTLAEQGQLHAYVHAPDSFMNDTALMPTDEDHLQSLLLFLHEQSPLPLSYSDVSEFIQYLRYFAQLGMLYHPEILYLLTDLHKAKDRDKITAEVFQRSLERLKTINSIHAYDYLNLFEFEQFFNDRIADGELTHGQAWYILDRLIELCRVEPITSYDIQTFLTSIQLEHHRQHAIYPKLMEGFQSLMESYSSSFAELCSLERELQKIVINRRISDDIRRRLTEMIHLCQRFCKDRQLLELVFGRTMNYKFYNKMKEVLRTKNLISRKQSTTAIVQIHKHFVQISRLNTSSSLSDQQIDSVLQNIQKKCSQQEESLMTSLKQMVNLGHLQDKSFIDYLTDKFLSTDSMSWNSEKCMGIQAKLQTWPSTLDLNHSTVREVVQHLNQLEKHDRIDAGTSMDIQNRLNQLARLGKCSSPQIQLILERIQQSHGKRFLADRDGFQSMQSLRLILSDLTQTIAFELYVQQLASNHLLAVNYNYRFRQFLYRILQNDLSLDELIRFRLPLKVEQQMAIDQVKRVIELIPKEYEKDFPSTLTDHLFERLKWNGRILNPAIRDPLLKLERCGVLSQDTFEDICNHLHRTDDISPFVSKLTKQNHLLLSLLQKINDLVNDCCIALQQSIQIKEQIYFLEDIIEFTDVSSVITIQARLLNASDLNDFHTISGQLTTVVQQEQFRLSRAQDLISTWNIKSDLRNVNEKQIIKLMNELADLCRLYDDSTVSLFSRCLEMKQISPVLYRNLIKELQRLRERAKMDRQAIDCVRTMEARVYKYDYRRLFHESLIKQLENRLKQIFHTLSHAYQQHFRLETSKKLNELVETYIKSNRDESSSEDLFSVLDSYLMSVEQGQLRPSTAHPSSISSDVTVPTQSSSSQSLKSVL